MKFGQLFVLVVATVLVGALVWYLGRTGDDSSVAGASPDRVAPELHTPGSSDLPDAGPDLPQAAPPEDVREAAGSLPVVDLAALSEDQLVRGRVVDAFGQPVAGAHVYMAREQGAFAVQIDLLKKDQWGGWLKIQHASCDADGGFAFDRQSYRTVQLAVRRGGHAPLRVSRPMPAPGISFEDLVLEPSVVLQGHVVDSAGRPVPDTQIHVLPPRRGGVFMTFMQEDAEGITASDAAGAFRLDELAAGPYHLRLVHPDHPDAAYRGRTERPGQQQAGLRIELEDGFELVGHVVGLQGVERDDLRVRARQRAGEDSAFDSGREVRLTADGSFRLRGLRSVEQRLVLVDVQEDRYWGSQVSEPVIATPGDTGVQLVYQSMASFSFQVLDSKTGLPVLEFQASAGIDWRQDLEDAEGKTLRQHPEGRARAGGLNPNEGETAQLRITATGYRTHDQEGIALAPGQNLDLGAILLEPVPLVSVRVVDADSGEPVKGARVSMREVQPGSAAASLLGLALGDSGADHLQLGDDSEVRSGRTDESGLLELSSFPGAEVRFTAQHKSYAKHEGAAVASALDAHWEHRIELTPGGTVVVQVLDQAGEPVAGARVQHEVEEASDGMVFFSHGGGGPNTDSTGRVTFEHLPGGSHHFRISERGGGAVFGDGAIFIGGNEGASEHSAEDGWVTVELAERTEELVVLRAGPRGSVTGRITEAGQPLAGAELVLKEKGEGGGMDFGFLAFGGAGGERAQSSGKGEYSFSDLQVGDYELRVTHPDRCMPTTFELRLAEGDNHKDCDLDLAVIEGRVTDGEGEPVAGVKVTARRDDGEEEGAGSGSIMISTVVTGGGGGAITFSSGLEDGTEVVTGQDGFYRLRGVQADVDLVVRAEPDEAGMQPADSESVRLGPNQVRRGVDVVLQAGGELEVRVLDASGQPAGGCMVRVRYTGESEEPVAGLSQFAQEGATTFTGLRPGPWEVTATAFGINTGDEPKTSESVGVQVLGGEVATADLQLP